jgi:hypothetical protein
MRFHHTTNKVRVHSIKQTGLLLAWATEFWPVIWLHRYKSIENAIRTVCRAHAWEPRDLVTLSIWCKRQEVIRAGPGIYYVEHDLPPVCIEGVTEYKDR